MKIKFDKFFKKCLCELDSIDINM